MASIYIRDVDEALYWKLKQGALDARVSFREYVLQLLAGDTKPVARHKGSPESSRPQHAPNCRCGLCKPAK